MTHVVEQPEIDTSSRRQLATQDVSRTRPNPMSAGPESKPVHVGALQDFLAFSYESLGENDDSMKRAIIP